MRRATSGNAPSSTSNSPSSAPRASIRLDVTPDTRFAPERLWARRTRGERMAATSDAVVVLPFVADTTALPLGSLAASLERAEGSTVARIFPGNVVPPPRPARRERRPAERARASSSTRRMGEPAYVEHGEGHVVFGFPCLVAVGGLLCMRFNMIWWLSGASLQIAQNALFFL